MQAMEKTGVTRKKWNETNFQKRREEKNSVFFKCVYVSVKYLACIIKKAQYFTGISIFYTGISIKVLAIEMYSKLPHLKRGVEHRHSKTVRISWTIITFHIRTEHLKFCYGNYLMKHEMQVTCKQTHLFFFSSPVFINENVWGTQY